MKKSQYKTIHGFMCVCDCGGMLEGDPDMTLPVFLREEDAIIFCMDQESDDGHKPIVKEISILITSL